MRLLRKPFPCDPLALARSWSRSHGTLLLATQVPWHGSGRSALLTSPRWTAWHDDEGTHWSGDVPQAHPPDVPFETLPANLARSWSGDQAPGPVFVGLAGWLSYDLGSLRWGRPHPGKPPFRLPHGWLGAYDAALVFDGSGAAELVVADLAPWLPAPSCLEQLWEERASQLSRPPVLADPPPCVQGSPVYPSAAWHRGGVETIQRHLRRGDAYQVNLTGFATATTTASPWEVFQAQAVSDPTAFAAFLCHEQATLTCHSPERLLRLHQGWAETAPIKGTMSKANGDGQQLRAREKDRAEHVMIVDLARNDLGRASRYGSIHVVELMEPLEMQKLVHLVTRVRGQVRDGQVEPLMRYLFPGGSITGAPKRASMEIVRAVETSARGPYTGSLGYHDRSGCSDWNIAIRTAIWQNQAVAFGCGGGIVLDSDADREYEEAVLKAESFFDTLDSLSTAATPLRSAAPRPVAP